VGFQVSKWQIGLVLIGAILLTIAVNATRAQTDGERYYDETGHSIRGPFLEHFDTNGALEVFGYPITDEFIEDGVLVQYFQHVKIEWHPENPSGSQVEFADIGSLLGYEQERLPADQIPAPGNPYCVYYAQTGHSVCNAFLDYYRDHGGEKVLGYPISEFVIERDRIVQSFEHAKLEWHPENPIKQKVQLANLGVVAFKVSDNVAALLNPQTPGNRPHTVTRINPRVSLKWPVTGRTGDQTIYVVVVDQQNRAVNDATINIVVHLPDGDMRYTLPRTNANGRTQLTFPFADTKEGEYVKIDVSAEYNNLNVQTRISFLPWK
jgi:hypothetical protein